MPNIKRYGSQRSLAIGFAVAGLGAVLAAQTAATQPAAAQAQTRNTSGSVRQDNLAAESVTVHHYASPADRARDALLIVEAKTAIADEGLADDYPLTVDADHGRVTLTGVLASQQDVRRAVTLVAGLDGVKGVNNLLTWQKSPR
ncbi:MAG: BON domain-containing protein [Candidatus Binataceae bacterium]|jgi:osmotically-inducible protein OsmY